MKDPEAAAHGAAPPPPEPAPDPGRPEYRGTELDPARGPGLGCFWLQVTLLAVLVVLTPVGVANHWPIEVTGTLLAVTIVLLFFVGQTVIFLLRLVAADRRTRRRPLAPGASPTIGQLEDEGAETGADESGPTAAEPGSGASSVRQ